MNFLSMDLLNPSTYSSLRLATDLESTDNFILSESLTLSAGEIKGRIEIVNGLTKPAFLKFHEDSECRIQAFKEKYPDYSIQIIEVLKGDDPITMTPCGEILKDPTKRLALTVCGHLFDKASLGRWAYQDIDRASCPTCRGPLANSQIQTVSSSQRSSLARGSCQSESFELSRRNIPILSEAQLRPVNTFLTAMGFNSTLINGWHWTLLIGYEISRIESLGLGASLVRAIPCGIGISLIGLVSSCFIYAAAWERLSAGSLGGFYACCIWDLGLQGMLCAIAAQFAVGSLTLVGVPFTAYLLMQSILLVQAKRQAQAALTRAS